MIRRGEERRVASIGRGGRGVASTRRGGRVSCPQGMSRPQGGRVSCPQGGEGGMSRPQEGRGVVWIEGS